MSFDSIPSFSMLDINKRDEDTIRKLKLALTSHGFFTITDHDIADEVLEKSYKVSQDFFSLPEEVKSNYAHPEKRCTVAWLQTRCGCQHRVPHTSSRTMWPFELGPLKTYGERRTGIDTFPRRTELARLSDGRPPSP